MDRKLQRHRAGVLRQHGFLVIVLMMTKSRPKHFTGVQSTKHGTPIVTTYLLCAHSLSTLSTSSVVRILFVQERRTSVTFVGSSSQDGRYSDNPIIAGSLPITSNR